jgi:hypothetical protein
VDPASGEVYVANGGLTDLTNATDSGSTSATVNALLDPLVLGDGAAGIESNLQFVESTIASGFVLLDAPGLFGGFQPSGVGQIGALQSVFPSEVVFGWQPPADSGLGTNKNSGLIVNQANFSSVYGKRPFGIAIRPDGARALAPFFQTGNFGVLDRTTQLAFPRAGTPTNVFSGIVAVTQTMPFDRYLIPSRGAFTAPIASINDVQTTNAQIPSRDEALLYPGPIAYAQNGRFAVAIHSGSRPPMRITATMPDFLHNDTARRQLVAAGFQIDPNSATGVDPDGVQVNSNGRYEVARGGGAVTILDDTAIANDLSASARDTLFRRPYFSTRPLCVTAAALPNLGCLVEPLQHVFSFGAPSSVQFNTPRGVSISPFVQIETPRSGQQLFGSTPFAVRWADVRAAQITITVRRLNRTAPEQSVDIGSFTVALSAEQRNTRSFTIGFAETALSAGLPFISSLNGVWYRVEFAIADSDDQIISSTFVDIRS